ncbi:MAG: DNA ligase D [Pseudomonadota bacterium]
MAATADPLATYRAKRDFTLTSEPEGGPAHTGTRLAFVVQKHQASRLHYDFRLELGGVLLSWAVPKGPSLDPQDKRLAVRTEDHPLSYATFEGTIPPKQYGAGTVIVWDHGTWQPVGDPQRGLAQGKLEFTLHGHKLAGAWELVKIQKPGERQEAWLLFKKRDDHARSRSEHDVVAAEPDSVLTRPAPRAVPAAAAPAAEPPLALSGAVKAPLPDFIEPQLATLSSEWPAQARAIDWLFEIKFDGYRLLTRIDDGVPRLLTRTGQDWTAKLPQLAADLARLNLGSAWIDGEIVVLGDDGASHFGQLQNSFDKARTACVQYFVFDLPYFEGHDLRSAPLYARRALLEQCLQQRHPGGDRLQFSATFQAEAGRLLASACRLHLEGVIAKRADAPYTSGRTTQWLKLKCHQRQEFVVGGYVLRTGAATEVGSLMLGLHDAQGRLVYCGNVGTGWTSPVARELLRRLKALDRADTPFAPSTSLKQGRWPKRSDGRECWVAPELVVEVSFDQWTTDRQVRHAVFIGVRDDKPAASIREEIPVAADAVLKKSPPPPPPPTPAAGGANKARGRATTHVDGIAVSHPGRVIDPSTGLTKIDLVRYYAQVAPWMLPHLLSRPCALMRGPQGIEGELFFQKHASSLHVPGLKEVALADPGHRDTLLLTLDSAQAMISAAQMNVIEFHTWNHTLGGLAKPNRMVFDLDPGEGVTWRQIQEGAVLTRVLLNELGLRCWLKTSGGKGLHVVVPLAARHTWENVKAFSKSVVEHLAHHIPDRFVAVSGPSNRVGRIFVDYLRNGRGATTVAAFSARARPGLPVSMPIAWEALESLTSSAQWSLASALEALAKRRSDPWADQAGCKQTLTAAMRRLA